MNSVKIIELKGKKQPFTVILQIVSVVAVLISGVMSLFSNMWMPLLYGMLSFALLIMAWNNYKLANRKIVAGIYVVFAVVTFVSMILELL